MTTTQIYPNPPILPTPLDANRDGYPDNWAEIAWVMKDWAGWRCENCGAFHSPATGYCLTVHHLDGNPMNCWWTNLLVCCQRCHLHIQATYIPGMIWLFDKPAWAFIREPYFVNILQEA